MPCPRQSRVATAKPRPRRSRTVSKYFSMNSARPWNRQTVPLRPGGGCQRAKRKVTPSRVLSVPETAPSGTGLAGMETSVMGCGRAGMREEVTPYSNLSAGIHVFRATVARMERSVIRDSYCAGKPPRIALRSMRATGRSRPQNIVFSICYIPLAGREPASQIRYAQAPSEAVQITGPALWADHPHVAQQGGYAMRTFDLAPLYRSTVGFDRLFSMLDGFEAAPGYPPYNIERTGENAYRISVAVAGFGENELSIEAKENTLTIKGEKQTRDEKNGDEVLYQGIAARAFERVFQLADYVQVKGATLENGLLHVDLVREIPEAKKPRQIPIGNGQTKVVEAKAA